MSRVKGNSVEKVNLLRESQSHVGLLILSRVGDGGF